MSGWPQYHGDDDEAAGETMRVGDYYPPASSGYEPQPSGPPYPTGSSGAPYGAPMPYGLPPQAAAPARRNSSFATMFMVTVMVVVIVAGAVSVVYILASGRDSAPQAPAAAAPQPAAPSASSRVDQCVVGEWQGTSVRLTGNGQSLTGDNGGVLRLRADGTGELDFGSGVTLTGNIGDVPSEVMIIGTVSFSYETTNQKLVYRDARVDARQLVFQSGKTVANERLAGGEDPEKYTCTGDSLQITADYQQFGYRRR